MAKTQALASDEFSTYPSAMDEYFQNHNVIIKTFPDKYDAVRENSFPDIKITSAEQFFDFLQNELQFWNSELEQKINILRCYTKLANAVQQFNQAQNYYLSNNITYGANALSSAVNIFLNDYLYSKTKLANYIFERAQESQRTTLFFYGFGLALQGNENQSVGNYQIGTFEGIYEGLIYRNEIKKAIALTKKVALDFSNNVTTANENFSKLNEDYTKSFHAHKKRIAEIQKQTDDEIDNLKTKTEEFFNLKESRSQELENLYENKLRLEKPATYWKEMASSYSKKGIAWLVASCATAIAIIAMLLLIICFVPQIFDTDSHWFDILKNTAIVTVIASVAIYMLRMFVKMAMSSLHLSRDAKEREQLSYFYLALLNNKAVTDKEKALVINSLFSRSDTGLLKGDSTPVMSTNVTDIIDKLQKS